MEVLQSLQLILSTNSAIFIFLLLSALANTEKCDLPDGGRNTRMNCSSSGEVSCNEGWTGELCNTAICREGCHPDHGYCTQPDECKCALGWRGKNCDECVPLPGCKHGSCNTTSYECKCDPGWEGKYCSIPVCREGCHSSKGYCKFPNECRCRIGWGGETCGECKSLPGCVNGYCTKPLECRCREGWTGLLCDKPVCRENCSDEHGYCLKPGECRCEVGWWGKNCGTCFPYPGCQHGTCTLPWECNCEEGWEGILCDRRNEDGGTFCDKNPGICMNGGTCINIHDEQNYTCSCLSLFTGKHCEYLAYSRASIFPIFNRNSGVSRSTTTTATTTTSTTTTETPTSAALVTSTTQPSVTKSTSTKPIHPEVSYSISTSFSASPTSSMIFSPQDGVTTLKENLPSLETPDEDSNEKSKSFSSESSLDISAQDERESTNQKYERQISPKRVDGHDKQFNRYVTRRRIISATPSNKPTVTRPRTPILVLELSEPTINFDQSPNDDTISNTDANSPQANQINGKNRFLRHHEAVIGLSANSGTTQHSTFFPIRKVRLVTQEKPPRPSRLRSNAFILKEGLDSLGQETTHGKNYFHTLNNNFSELPPQTRINRRTGVHHSASVNSIPVISLGRFTTSQSHELTSSRAQEQIDKIPKKEKPKTYYEEHYNGRVHIGDVTEVDKHAPLEEIVDAYIELKKLT